MIVTGWNNGDHYPSGAGYGLKINAVDRDRYFHREWKSVFLELEGQIQLVEVNIAKPSFWGKTCRELIHVQIGRWMLKNGLAPWPKDLPPNLYLEPMGEPRHFRLSLKPK